MDRPVLRREEMFCMLVRTACDSIRTLVVAVGLQRGKRKGYSLICIDDQGLWPWSVAGYPRSRVYVGFANRGTRNGIISVNSHF